MKNIIFIAPAAAGKGTIAQLVEKKYNMPQVSMGDLFRDITTKGTDLAKKVKDLIDNGIFVDDATAIEVIKERIMQEDCKNGYVLDGFPRNLAQAEAYGQLLKDINMELGVVVLLEVDKSALKSRIISRVTCPKCKKIYNNIFPKMMPKTEGICDKCKVELVHRDDDNEAAFEVRYNTYLEKTAPLIDYYEKKGVLRRIDSTERDIAFEQLEAILND